MEFWNEIAIDKSFKILQELRRKFDFVLIGGWAVYFLTKAIKSKDVDVIVDYKELSRLRTSIGIQKNDFLKNMRQK